MSVFIQSPPQGVAEFNGSTSNIEVDPISQFAAMSFKLKLNFILDQIDIDSASSQKIAFYVEKNSSNDNNLIIAVSKVSGASDYSILVRIDDGYNVDTNYFSIDANTVFDVQHSLEVSLSQPAPSDPDNHTTTLNVTYDDVELTQQTNTAALINATSGVISDFSSGSHERFKGKMWGFELKKIMY